MSQTIGIPVRHIVGPVTGIAVGLAFVLPRTAWITLAIISMVLVLCRPLTPRVLHGLIKPEPVTAAFALLCAWAAISTIWAIEPSDGALKAAFLFLIALFAHAAVRTVDDVDPELLNAFGVGLVTAMIGMSALLAFEIWSGQALARTLAEILPSLQRPGKHMLVRDGEVLLISDNEINRRTCIFTLLFLPSLAVARHLIGGRAGQVASFILLIEAGLIAAGTKHQSSQLALFAGGTVLALYLASPRIALAAVTGGWIVATLLVVPIASIAYQQGLSRDERLPFSFRERVSIWGWQAGQVRLRPLLGAGANTTPAVDLERKAEDSSAGVAEDRLGARYPGRHAHNFYLQAWYELGAVGAALFLGVGLVGLRLISRLMPQDGRLALAQFAVVAGMIATSYGFWQIWVQGSIAVSAIALAASGRLPKPT